MKLNENGEVVEYEEHISHVTSTSHYSKQNGSNGIAIPGETKKQLNGASQVFTRVETITVQSAEPAVTEVTSLSSPETHEFLSGE